MREDGKGDVHVVDLEEEATPDAESLLARSTALFFLGKKESSRRCSSARGASPSPRAPFSLRIRKKLRTSGGDREGESAAHDAEDGEERLVESVTRGVSDFAAGRGVRECADLGKRSRIESRDTECGFDESRDVRRCFESAQNASR